MNRNKNVWKRFVPFSDFSFLSLAAILLFSFSLSGCKYNDDDLWDEIGLIKQELESMKSQISTLKTLVEATDGSKTITSIRETETGYTITFSDNNTISILHGKDGTSAPEIGIALFDGVYYWTKGQGTNNWLTDASGNKIAVAGHDGAAGAAGSAGTNGITPQMKIEDGYWYVSTDNGAQWEKLGKATGDSGSSFFSNVTHDDNYATFVLTDGTEFKIAMGVRLKIELETTTLKLEAGKNMEVSYKLLNAIGSTQVEVISSDAVKAKVSKPDAAAGTIVVYAENLALIDEYTKVVVLATDEVRTAMTTLTFDVEEGVLRVIETYEVDGEAQLLTIPVETNLVSYAIEIEESAKSWLSKYTAGTRAIRIENEVFSVLANTSGSMRSAIVTLTGGGITRKVSVAQLKQEGTSEPETPITGKVELDKLYGYGVGTTGGAGATSANIHHFNDGKSFRDYLAAREKKKDKTPAILYLSGTFTKNDGRAASSPWFDVKDTENLSIYGVDGFVMENVGLFVVRSSNIIIRNLYIKQPKADNGADGISMQKSSKVWVDHCTFESMNQTHDYEDGSCDITHGTYDVTVSWCHFIRTQKTCLVGHSNSATEDKQITVTFHHNFFDLSSSRHPRVRFGKAHVYNNYYKEVTTYGVGSAYEAMVLVEDNYFDGVQLPTDICTYPAKPKSGSSTWVSNLTGSVAGYLYERGNTYANKPSNAGPVYPFTNVEWKAYNGEKLSTPYEYNDFKPSYAYVVDETESLPGIVSSSAGAKRLPGYDKAPIAVDNGGMTPGTVEPEPEEPETPENALANGWKWMAYNNSVVTPTTNAGALTLEAFGKFESGQQTFGYVYREVTGDFVATVQVDSYVTASTSNQSMAGLMLTPDFLAVGNDFFHAMASQTAVADKYYQRSTRVSVANAGRGEMTKPATVIDGVKPILKVERLGNDVLLSYSLDGGDTFGKEYKATFSELPEKVYIGLAVNSGDSKKTATAVFSNFTIDEQTYSF